MSGRGRSPDDSSKWVRPKRSNNDGRVRKPIPLRTPPAGSLALGLPTCSARAAARPSPFRLAIAARTATRLSSKRGIKGPKTRLMVEEDGPAPCRVDDDEVVFPGTPPLGKPVCDVTSRHPMYPSFSQPEQEDFDRAADNQRPDLVRNLRRRASRVVPLSSWRGSPCSISNRSRSAAAAISNDGTNSALLRAMISGHRPQRHACGSRRLRCITVSLRPEHVTAG